ATLPVHISVDNNVLPYITVTYWQIDLSNGYHIRQIGESCVEPPDNSVQAASRIVAEKLKSLGTSQVYLHGDASTRAANTIDENKRSWLDLFIEGLKKHGIDVIDCVGNKNPNVSISGEFINTILEGEMEDTDIIIDEECKVSIEDYMSVQKDVNGGILKKRIKNKETGQSYEEYGHCSDTFRYVIVDLLSEQFIVFSNQRKRNLYAGEGLLHYYNPNTNCDYSESLLYVLPDFEGKTVSVYGKLCGENWHIVSASVSEKVRSTDEIKNLCLSLTTGLVVFECTKAYFPLVRELRLSLPEVRIKNAGDDIGKRINATSSLVKERVLFNPEKTDNDVEYGRFISSLLDYRKGNENIHASACLSGFVQFVSKRFSRVNAL
ncbi:MAG: PBSX family phage terminase large subunit, partial [Muribaculaceae bacterium]|nr:PBSX family phage terminase large subunit [Muribaculaceae bacterium]